MPADFLPTSFGPYLLQRPLSEGGMAEVFLAQGPTGNTPIALKRLLPQHAQRKDLTSLFTQELRLASLLLHPNIVRVLDCGEVDGRAYLAMEYLDGYSLARVLTQAYGPGPRIPVEMVCSIVSRICEGLQYVHDFAVDGTPLRLVHRDVSPSNVMLTLSGEVKLLDFGLTHMRVGPPEAVVRGKYPYCSPEQFQSAEIDRRSDLFSLGVVMHEALSGKRLFRRKTDAESSVAVLNDIPPPPSAHRPEIPAELDRIVLKALQKDPARRYPSARALAEDLAPLSSSTVLLTDYLHSLFPAPLRP